MIAIGFVSSKSDGVLPCLIDEIFCFTLTARKDTVNAAPFSLMLLVCHYSISSNSTPLQLLNQVVYYYGETVAFFFSRQ